MDVFASLAVRGKTRRANGDLAYALPFPTGSRMLGGFVVEMIDRHEAKGFAPIPQLTARVRARAVATGQPRKETR